MILINLNCVELSKESRVSHQVEMIAFYCSVI